MDLTAEEIIDNILNLRDDLDGWIPDADYKRLAEAIGVPPERLKKAGNR